MKLCRVGPPGQELPALLDSSGSYRSLEGIVADFDEAFFDDNRIAELKTVSIESLPKLPSDSRLGPPVARPSKIVCVGLNYRDHAKETGTEIPTEPVLFMKSSTALCGCSDSLILPKDSSKTDWEVELAFVVGARASYISEEDALSYIAGYCLFNDYSERHFQKERGGQWVKGKSADTFGPLGPFLATTDEFDALSPRRIWLQVNGEIRQDSNTGEMIFAVPIILSYISQFMTLLPGDVISTGTPAGVAKPGQYLRPGDSVRWGIDGLGEATHRVNAGRWG